MWIYIYSLLDPEWDDGAHPEWLPAQHWCSGGLDDLYRSPNPGPGDPDGHPWYWPRRSREPHPVRRDRHYVPVWTLPQKRKLPPIETIVYDRKPRPPAPPPAPPIDTSRPYVLETLCGPVVIYPPAYHAG